MEFCPKMGPSTGFNDLFCKTVYILPGFHSCSQLQPRIQPDPIISRPPQSETLIMSKISRLMNKYEQVYTAYEQVYTVYTLYIIYHAESSVSRYSEAHLIDNYIYPK